MSLVENAKLGWQGSVPVNKMFDDPYFSLESGLAETNYVFLQHNNLPAAFSGRHSFSIGETGFGTGLNFLVTAQSWILHRSTNQSSHSHLYYYSIEKYPISKSELPGIHKNWPQFHDLSRALISQYPGNCPGFHQIYFLEENITLVLMIGDVCEMLDKMLVNIDAWYLDGFSPSKNPDMWSEKVFGKIARLSQAGATFATFTAAGFVRRNLQSAGFNVKKAPGFGKKREMLCGEIVNPKSSDNLPPWYALSKIKPDYSQDKQLPSVVIIGGGIAGLSCALALAEKNIKSILIESGETTGTGASGNPAGIVLPRINTDLDLVSQFYISCFESAVNGYSQLKNKLPELEWYQNGVLQFEPDDRLEKIARLLLPSDLVSVVDSKTASEIAGIGLDKSAIFYPQAGTINPFQLCQIMAVAAGDKLQIIFQSTAQSLTKEDDVWIVKGQGEEEICRAENVIIANGFDAARLLGTEVLTVQPSRGQLSYLSANKKSQVLKANLCGVGYIIPAQNGKHIIGATYGDVTASLKKVDHDKNWESASSLLPGFISDKDSISHSDGRVSFRTISQDHLPIVGPVVSEMFYKENYSDLHYGKPEKNYAKAVYIKGLYLTVGHGSRGLVSCMGTSGYLASLISDSPIVESADTVALLHPGRFIIRAYKKNKEIAVASG